MKAVRVEVLDKQGWYNIDSEAYLSKELNLFIFDFSKNSYSSMNERLASKLSPSSP